MLKTVVFLEKEQNNAYNTLYFLKPPKTKKYFYL